MNHTIHIGSFYYHYKHDPSKDIYNYAYEIVNIGHHTEIEGLEASAMVIYAPLYPEAGVYKIGKHYHVRPLAMFLEPVTKEGDTFSRFTEITDPEIIKKLQEKKKELYS